MRCTQELLLFTASTARPGAQQQHWQPAAPIEGGPSACSVASAWSSSEASASSTAAGASTSSFILASSCVAVSAAPLPRPVYRPSTTVGRRVSAWSCTAASRWTPGPDAQLCSTRPPTHMCHSRAPQQPGGVRTSRSAFSSRSDPSRSSSDSWPPANMSRPDSARATTARSSLSSECSSSCCARCATSALPLPAGQAPRLAKSEHDPAVSLAAKWTAAHHDVGAKP